MSSSPKQRLPAEERKKQIVEVATKLFSEKGFHGTTTREIAEAAGISEAIVFRLFETKEKLYAAIIETHKEPDGACLSLELMKKKDDYAVFFTIARCLLSVGENPTFLRLLLFSALEDSTLSDMFFESRVTYYFGQLANYIQQRINDGAFEPVDPYLAARAFTAMSHQHVMAQELFGEKKRMQFDKEQVAETFTKLFLKGLEKN